MSDMIKKEDNSDAIAQGGETAESVVKWTTETAELKQNKKVYTAQKK